VWEEIQMQVILSRLENRHQTRQNQHLQPPAPPQSRQNHHQSLHHRPQPRLLRCRYHHSQLSRGRLLSLCWNWTCDDSQLAILIPSIAR
jgi:hypothetical protein